MDTSTLRHGKRTGQGRHPLEAGWSRKAWGSGPPLSASLECQPDKRAGAVSKAVGTERSGEHALGIPPKTGRRFVAAFQSAVSCHCNRTVCDCWRKEDSTIVSTASTADEVVYLPTRDRYKEDFPAPRKPVNRHERRRDAALARRGGSR